MSENEPLTKKEFAKFKTNHFNTLCLKVVGIATDIKWLKWLIGGLSILIISRFVLSFFNIV